MMMRKKREAADSENQVSPQIDTLLLIDRNVDLLTPLFTQLTYEGLIDELYGIQNSKSCKHPQILHYSNVYLKARKKTNRLSTSYFSLFFGCFLFFPIFLGFYTWCTETF